MSETNQPAIKVFQMHAKTVQLPEGYIRYDGPGSQIMLIERENSVSKNGNRYEVWVPIKKL